MIASGGHVGAGERLSSVKAASRQEASGAAVRIQLAKVVIAARSHRQEPRPSRGVELHLICQLLECHRSAEQAKPKPDRGAVWADPALVSDAATSVARTGSSTEPRRRSRDNTLLSAVPRWCIWVSPVRARGGSQESDIGMRPT